MANLRWNLVLAVKEVEARTKKVKSFGIKDYTMDTKIADSLAYSSTEIEITAAS